jgi:hypothetical protein
MTDQFSGLPADIAQKLAEFERETNARYSVFSKPLLASPPPSELFHYTDYLGLKGILETGRLWLSDIFSLNDPSELNHGVFGAAEILSQKAKAAPDIREIALLADIFAAFRTKLSSSADYFVCSFSIDGDELGQWRGYADNGRGFRLGFDGAALETDFSAANKLPSTVSTFPVTYDDRLLNEMNMFNVEKALPLISLPRSRAMDKATRSLYLQYLPSILAVQTIQISSHFKHESYENEKEYRFLQIFPENGRPDVKIRTRPNRLIRYIEYDWRAHAPDALRTVWVGPASDDTAMQFAHDCIRQYVPRTKVEVKRSSVPYRP